MSDEESTKVVQESLKEPVEEPVEELVEDDEDDEDEDEDDSELDSDSQGSTEIEEIDLTENPLYQVLSTLLEDSDGNNICVCVNRLADSIDNQNKLMTQLLTTLLAKN